MGIMSTPNKKRGNYTEALLVWGVLGVLGLGVGVFYAGYLGGAFLTGQAVSEYHPVGALVGVVKGASPWSAASTVISCGSAAVLLVVGVLVGRRWLFRSPQQKIDRAGRYMGSGADIAFLKKKQALADARRLGVDSPGLPIAKTLAGEMLFSSWENVCVDIWGPRTGKTTSRAIPGIIAAPGAVLVTSNKRDIVDATRRVRQGVGQVWVFDPQQVAGEPASWWWDPLSYVSDDVKARKLAQHFAAGSRDEKAKTDAFFDEAAQDLLAALLLAAAVNRDQITQVYQWLTRETEDEPASILHQAGFVQMAQAVEGVISSPDRQRGGVYGVARQMANCLTSQAVLDWITPAGDGVDRREQLVPEDFVRGKNTLYSLSKEGAGTAGPLVTALTVATVEAAEEMAIDAGGRLSTPMVVMLDEAANVCRWAELPNLYSHYGSRGIVVCTILQSWSQGVAVWGQDGMRKLWSAANIKVYGGGVSEAQFLSELSQLIGDYTYTNVSRSYSRQHGASSSVDVDRKDRIMDVSDLSALPRGRAVVFASGAPAVLVKTIPWYAGEHAAAVNASLEAYDPARRATILRRGAVQGAGYERT